MSSGWFLFKICIASLTWLAANMIQTFPSLGCICTIDFIDPSNRFGDQYLLGSFWLILVHFIGRQGSLPCVNY